MGNALQKREFLDTLETTSRLLNQSNVPWMVIGGAAMVLLGFEDGPAQDIDIVLSSLDAASLAARFSWPNHADAQSLRFRSDLLLRPDFGPVPVEILGGFRIKTQTGWIEVEPNEVQQVSVGGQFACVPAPAKLTEIFRLCSREKDLQRAALLERGRPLSRRPQAAASTMQQK